MAFALDGPSGGEVPRGTQRYTSTFVEREAKNLDIYFFIYILCNAFLFFHSSSSSISGAVSWMTVSASAPTMTMKSVSLLRCTCLNNFVYKNPPTLYKSTPNPFQRVDYEPASAQQPLAWLV